MVPARSALLVWLSVFLPQRGGNYIAIPSVVPRWAVTARLICAWTGLKLLPASSIWVFGPLVIPWYCKNNPAIEVEVELPPSRLEMPFDSAVHRPSLSVDPRLMRLMRVLPCPAGTIISEILKEKNILLARSNFFNTIFIPRSRKILTQDNSVATTEITRKCRHLATSLKIFKDL